MKLCGGGAGEPCLYESWSMWPWMRDAGHLLRLDTNWKVFSARPPTTDWYLVFPAKLKSGVEVDIFPALKGRKYFYEPFCAIDYGPPDAFAYSLRDERWTKYLENIVHANPSDAEKDYRLRLGQFLCREWNHIHKNGPHSLVSFKMVGYFIDNWFIRDKRLDGKEGVLWEHICNVL